MPFGTIGKGEFGTRFIGYARSPTRIERMLENMFVGDPPGNYDRILNFSVPVTEAPSLCLPRHSWDALGRTHETPRGRSRLVLHHHDFDSGQQSDDRDRCRDGWGLGTSLVAQRCRARGVDSSRPIKVLANVRFPPIADIGSFGRLIKVAGGQQDAFPPSETAARLARLRG